MSKADSKPRITWVVVPIALCLGVGLYRPSLLGFAIAIAASVICYLVARHDKWKESARVTACVAVVALSYGIIGGVVGGKAVAEANRQANSPRVDLNEMAARQKVFAMAMQYKGAIKKGHEDVNNALKSGATNYTFLRKRLESNEEAHVRHQQFTADFYRLTSEQLTEIVNEGTADDWPY